MMYLGMEFKNANEVKEWSKRGNINTYRNLAKRFNENPTMELNSMMYDLAQILMNRFGLTPSEIEEIELSTL